MLAVSMESGCDTDRGWAATVEDLWGGAGHPWMAVGLRSRRGTEAVGRASGGVRGDQVVHRTPAVEQHAHTRVLHHGAVPRLR